MKSSIANKPIYARSGSLVSSMQVHSAQSGITLFEHAAIEITRGFCSNPGYANDSPTQTARDAIEQVKALIDELANEKI